MVARELMRGKSCEISEGSEARGSSREERGPRARSIRARGSAGGPCGGARAAIRKGFPCLASRCRRLSPPAPPRTRRDERPGSSSAVLLFFFLSPGVGVGVGVFGFWRDLRAWATDSLCVGAASLLHAERRFLGELFANLLGFPKQFFFILLSSYTVCLDMIILVRGSCCLVFFLVLFYIYNKYKGG